MKKILATLSIIALLFISSCGSLEPKCSELPEIKNYVFINSLTEEQQEKFAHDFVEKIFLGGLGLEGMASVIGYPSYLLGAVITLFYDITDEHWISGTQKQLQKKFLEKFNKITDKKYEFYDHRYIGGGSEKCEIAEQICEGNLEDAHTIFNTLIDHFFTLTMKVACDYVETISWDYDLINTGDTYDGYEVIYRVKNGYYTRISLIEFDSDGGNSWEAKILKTTSSLSQIHY